MSQEGLAPNEAMQLQELLTLKNLSLTKAVTMSPLISDDELKAFIKNDCKVTQEHIKELREYMEQSRIAPSHKND